MTYTAQSSRSSSNSTGIVFIHGAGLGGWIWSDVASKVSVPYVCADYTALNRSNNEATLADYVNSLHQQVAGLKVDKVVIVAHSIGGVVGVELSKRLGDKVAAFMAVSAAIPKPGGSFISTLPFPQKFVMPIILKLAGTKPPESAIRSGLGGGLSAAQADEIVAKFQQESSHVYSDATSDQPIPKFRSYYLRTTHDKEFTMPVQNASLARLSNTAVFDIDSGHMPMLSHADLVAEQINAALRANDR